MQGVYPEGFVFMHVLYGLSWVEVAQSLSSKDELYREAHGEIDWALRELASETAKQPFDPNLKPAYGIFYRGWTNYLLGRKLRLFPENQRDTADVKLFQQNCSDILHALDGRKSPFLESYAHACWPADMVVGMASVAIGADLFRGAYTEEIRAWLSRAASKTDSLGLIPHSCNCDDGGVAEPARGSSQSLILHFLLEIDPEYAWERFLIYREHYLCSRLGLPAIREYPKERNGDGDIDSGPVIWGVGGAASIVGQRVMAKFCAPDEAIALRNSIEVFALGCSVNGAKTYLAGRLPVVDAFIAWANSVEADESHRLQAQTWWWLKTQCGVLLCLVMGGMLIYRLWY